MTLYDEERFLNSILLIERWSNGNATSYMHLSFLQSINYTPVWYAIFFNFSTIVSYLLPLLVNGYALPVS